MAATVATKEVTRGVFDPRTYKEVDKENWARKRRSDWMSTTGQIHYVRERTVASQEREAREAAEAAAPAPVPAEVEVEKAAVVVMPVRTTKPAAQVQWVGRRRSDITRERYV